MRGIDIVKKNKMYKTILLLCTLCLSVCLCAYNKPMTCVRIFVTPDILEFNYSSTILPTFI